MLGFLPRMHIHFPNSAKLQNFSGFIDKCDLRDHFKSMHFTHHPGWVNVHPLALSFAAANALRVHRKGGKVTADVTKIGSLPFLIRMGLFDYLKVDPGKSINEHSADGRFIPLRTIKSAKELKQFLVDIIPLLHLPINKAYPIIYVVSEIIRNCVEHSRSKDGAVVCAQYYRETDTCSLGVVDTGIGVHGTMSNSHEVRTPEDAILLALQPGYTGVTPKWGGNEYNAGAGLYYTKSIARLGGNYFYIYSGDYSYKLLPKQKSDTLSSHPSKDRHVYRSDMQPFYGTALGIDFKVNDKTSFNVLMDRIRMSYNDSVKKTKRQRLRKANFS